jgi:hypothetical protein
MFINPIASASLPSDWKTSWARFLGVILLCLCLLGLSLLTGCSRPPMTSSGGTGTQPATAAEQNKWLGNFSRVPGTRFLYAQISQSRDAGIFSLSYSDYDNRNANNLVFFDPTTGKVTQLLPNNQAQIAITVTLPEVTAAGSSEPPKQVNWFLYGIIKTDTNNDQKLTTADQMVLAITDAGGQGYTELIDKVDQLYGQTLNDANTMTLIYRKEGKLLSSTVNLQKRQVTATKVFPSLGSDVKLT